MTNEKIPEYYQCKDCKKYCEPKDLVKVKVQPNLIQLFTSEKPFKIVCKECISKKHDAL